MEVLFVIDAVGHHQSLLNSTLLHWIRTNPIKNCDHSNREDVSLKLNARKRVDLFDGIFQMIPSPRVLNTNYPAFLQKLPNK